MAEYLKPPPPKLSSATTQSKTDTELQETIVTGRTGTAMTGLESVLDTIQMANLLAYLRSLKSKSGCQLATLVMESEYYESYRKETPYR